MEFKKQNKPVNEEPAKVEEKPKDIYDPKVKAAAILILGGKTPKEACKNGVDISAAKEAALKMAAGTYFEV